MPAVGKSSSKAGIHYYLKKDFEWPVYYVDDEKILCSIDDDEFIEQRIEEFRKKRTFYLNERLCKLFGVNYKSRGAKLKVTKHLLASNPVIQMHWDRDQLKRWANLRETAEETIILVNNGASWWTAETTWIKAK